MEKNKLFIGYRAYRDLGYSRWQSAILADEWIFYASAVVIGGIIGGY